MLGPGVGISIGVSFVATAGANVWLMLRPRGNRARQIRAHRLGGYLFLTLFSVMFLYMNRRVSGITHGLSLTIVIHSALAFLLLPLLLLKIMIARRYKHHSGALLALGLAIFIVSFLLVAITSFPVLWASDILGNIPLWVDISVIALAVAVFATLFFRRPAVTPSATSAQPADNSQRQPLHLPGALRQPGARKSQLLLLSRIQDQTHDTKTFRFLLPQRDGFQARPGQFLTFNWIVDGKAVARSYSISSSPLQTGYLEITAKRAEGGCVSVFLNQHAQIGLTVEAKGPSGRFCFDELQHERIVLIAGGSGITPMMSMLRYIDDLGLATEVTLIYFVRTPRDVIFANELDQLRASIRNFRFLVIVSKPDAAWRGGTGHLSRELLENNVNRIHSSTFFLCGPQGLMASASSILHALGIPDKQIQQESFGARAAPSSAPDSQPTAAKLVLNRSHRSCALLEGKTLLETAEANGILIPSSCRQGECGTCAVQVLRGSVRMDREDGLSAEQKEQGYVLACVARVDDTVTVDL